VTIDHFKRIAFLLGACSALSFGSGCKNDFDPGSRVTSLRVLAVQADAPYAKPGESVSLDALAFDPSNRPITWGWTYCENPQDTSTVGCLRARQERVRSGERVSMQVGRDETQFSLTVPDDALSSLGDGPPGRAVVGVVGVACPGVLGREILGETTESDPLPVVCRDANGSRLSSFDFVVGMKRIFVREKDRNQNPEIATVSWDGEPWPETLVPKVAACDKETNVADDCDSAFRHRIRVDATTASFEVGTSETGEPFEEQLVVQYYATEGTFADDVRVATSPETEWVARPSARGEQVRLWFVLRDNRGGVTWTERHLSVSR